MLNLPNKRLPLARQLFAWIFLVAYVLTLSACGSKTAPSTNGSSGSVSSQISFRTLEEIKANGTIKVGVYADNNSVRKFDEAVAANIAKELGVDAETVPLSVNERISALEDGKVDLVIANLTVKDERKEKVDFCEPYAFASTTIMTPEGAPLTSEEEVNGAKIGVITNTSNVTTLKAYFPEATLVEYSSYDELYKALKTGNVDAVGTDNQLGNMWIKENEGYMVSVICGGRDSYESIAPAVAKGNAALKDAVNKIVQSMLKNEMFAEITEAEVVGYLTYNGLEWVKADMGIKSGVNSIDGTYRSDDGSTVLTVNGDKLICYLYYKMSSEQFYKNFWETLKKARATE